MTATQGLHRTAGVRGWSLSPSGFVKRRGWNGNSRIVPSGVIMAVPQPQQENSGVQCPSHAQMEKYGCFAGSDTYTGILKIIKLDPAKELMQNLLAFSRFTHLFWRVQGRLKTSFSSVGVSEGCIARSAHLRAPGCTQGCAICAVWTPLYEKAHHRPGESREVQACVRKAVLWAPCFFYLRAEVFSVVQHP